MANQSKSAVVEDGDTENHWLYGNKERQPQSSRRGKSSDKGSTVFGQGTAKFPWSNMRFPLGMFIFLLISKLRLGMFGLGYGFDEFELDSSLFLFFNFSFQFNQMNS